jgi:hypothetical protein
MNRVKAILALTCVTASMWIVAGPAQATECTNGKPCPPACQLNKELYIDENGNIGWAGSGRPIDCYV